MDTMMPPVLQVLTSVRMEMQMGKSVSRALLETVDGRNDSYGKALKIWFARVSAGQESQKIVASLPDLNRTSGRRHFMAVIDRGLHGSPIDQNLAELEAELLFQAECEYEKHLQTLPLKLLLPLTLFILPGVMTILIVPLLNQLKTGF